MIRRRLSLYLVAVTLFATSPLYADTPLVDRDQEFQQALADFDHAQQLLVNRPNRARELFRSAARRFENIIAMGVENGQLEYNLGNCYLQAGDIGIAIVHYRRAERLSPGHPYLKDNLHTARQRCTTVIERTRRGAVMRNFFFWHYETSMTARWTALTLFFFTFWGFMILRTLFGRRSLTISSVVCGALIVALVLSVSVTYWSERHTPEGVITALDVAVYKGPGSGYQRQFEQPLQPGVEFTLRERRGGWWAIELPDGHSGWISADQADLIPHQPI